jgi:hypothetical protein
MINPSTSGKITAVLLTKPAKENPTSADITNALKDTSSGESIVSVNLNTLE